MGHKETNTQSSVAQNHAVPRCRCELSLYFLLQQLVNGCVFMQGLFSSDSPLVLAFYHPFDLFLCKASKWKSWIAARTTTAAALTTASTRRRGRAAPATTATSLPWTAKRAQVIYPPARGVHSRAVARGRPFPSHPFPPPAGFN